MANRFEQKPDPTIKKNVIRSRKTARSSGAAKGFVVAASLAATLSGWALFSYGDAQNAATLQATDATQTVAASTVQQTTTVAATATPIVTTVQQSSSAVSSSNSIPQVSLASQINNQAASTATATATPTANATATTTTVKATATPQTVTTTKSSR